MRRFSFFMLLVCLLATTAFVFASSKKFANEGLYADQGGGNYKQLSSESGATPSGTDVQIGSSRPMSVSTPLNTYNVVYFNGSSYQPVEAIGAW